LLLLLLVASVERCPTLKPLTKTSTRQSQIHFRQFHSNIPISLHLRLAVQLKNELGVQRRVPCGCVSGPLALSGAVVTCTTRVVFPQRVVVVMMFIGQTKSKDPSHTHSVVGRRFSILTVEGNAERREHATA
jgi:hypothetical protein